MGSLETGLPLKRDGLLRSSSATRSDRHAFLQRPRSRFSRFLFFKKLDYLQLVCTFAVFLFFVILFEMFLPGSVSENSNDSWKLKKGMVSEDLMYLKEMGSFDFGDDIRFEPSRLLEKFNKEAKELNFSSTFNTTQHRFGYRKPQLALVFEDLSAGPQQLLIVTVATALREIGYEIQVYSETDGPVRNVWKNIGVPVTISQISNKLETAVDWLNFEGILVFSLEARNIISSLMQEPFKTIPVIWTIHEKALALRSRKYISSGQIDILNDWKKVFSRASVAVFPNHFLPMMYSAFDAGNYYVIPGSPTEPWAAETTIASENSRMRMGYGPEDTVIAVVGSQFLYKGLWLEHALILQALLPLFWEFPSDYSSSYHPKILVLSGNSTNSYSLAVEAIAANLSYPRGAVKHIAVEGGLLGLLKVADFVIYGSFFEEQSFPEVLLTAMCIGKPIVAPDLSIIKEYVDDRVNGYLFPKENIGVLSQIMLEIIFPSTAAHNVGSLGKKSAKNLMVRESIEGYAYLLSNVLKLPSEVASPKSVADIPSKLKEEWRWNLFEEFFNSTCEDRTLRSSGFLDKFEEMWNHTQRESFGSSVAMDDSFSYGIWEEEKNNEIFNIRKRREEEELKDRTEQPHGTWEEIYRSAKRADRSKNDLHERDEGELERTGQPLCIYEPYFGEGTWSFLHLGSLYRGIGLSTKGRRRRTDDIDASSRLPLLNNPYYRDILGEYGAFFAIANRVDRVHKNAWIGFQSWRATARKVSLSKIAEKALLDAIQTNRHGDALYFWARMDVDPRNHLKQDFWSFCDAINAGNCRLAFSGCLKKMYGVELHFSSLPLMPNDGGTWSVMSSWALPTKSFLEFVMFSRMFVDALDAEMYDEHRQSGYCYLSLYKDKHCYSRILELLVNVWAYHSARKIVYVNPETGLMQEQHKLENRRGKMWVKWFSLTTLKSMDEDLAEEADSDRPKRRWLWPSTGEVVWQGVFDKERNLRNRQKEKRRQQSRDKLSRMRKKRRQKVIGKYVKPPPDEELENSNSTTLATSIVL
ncbi:hypothetical protein K2173_025355 [Erythroxylum novogranatense]|uniref:Glycosyl transferase family 1 domain-containing protein n=1 Tax=Erythroxylum novogranatense TaxID=1862640 RepID=A0AAV8UHL9_9ROSI|nr:hypothetical protein K2173_025355 [Erythroxylum novogranatense]